MQTAIIALQNGLVLVEDAAGGVPPQTMTEDKVLATESCLAVVCMHEIDGETKLVLGEASQVEPEYALDFDGMIETPSRSVKLTTVMNETILITEVADVRTRVRIWRNHPEWPDQVTVGWE